MPPFPAVPPSSPVSSDPAAPLFLVAEDEDDLRFVIVHLLREAFPRSQVMAHANGQDALLDLPVMDGPTFVQQLRVRASSLPILMGSGCPEARQEGWGAGISCFLDKDDLHSHLITAVRSLLKDPAFCCENLPGLRQRASR